MQNSLPSTDANNETSLEKRTQTSFVTKVIVVTVAVIAIFSFLLPDTDKLRKFDTPINRVYVLSFVQNPEAFYMTSQYWEQKGKYQNAARDIRLAIGLLEMHHADPSVLKRYQDRLKSLERHH